MQFSIDIHPNKSLRDMSVTLRKRKNADDSTTLLLDIYHNGQRRREFLNDLKLFKPANPADRQANKEKLALAKKIEMQRGLELSANDYATVWDTGKKTVVTEWMQDYVNNYKKKDKRNMQGALNKFRNFLAEEKLLELPFGLLTETIVADFQDYLGDHCKGEGVSSYFNRFKKMIKQACRAKLLQHNPAAEVKTVKANAKTKATLTLTEIKLLSETPTQSQQVKKAFLFSCVTGLRWADIKALNWKNINRAEKYMIIEQTKTGNAVRINLNDTAVKLLNFATKANGLVFDLPSANGANKTLKKWVARAGIEKEITWHNARHSFGTNLVFHGADVTTASSLLGHTTLKHTQRYVKAANDLKQRATDKLNFDL